MKAFLRRAIGLLAVLFFQRKRADNTDEGFLR